MGTTGKPVRIRRGPATVSEGGFIMIHSVAKPGKEMSQRSHPHPPSQETYLMEEGKTFCGERKECDLFSFPTISYSL